MPLMDVLFSADVHEKVSMHYIRYLVNLILNQYFVSHRCLIVISDSLNNFEYIGNIPIVHIGVNYTNEKILNEEQIFRYHGCQGIIISTIKSVTVFTEIEKLIKLNMERFNMRQYLFIPSEEANKENIENIFHLSEISYVSDILIIVAEYVSNYTRNQIIVGRPNMKYHLFTHRYTGQERNNEKILLDTWFTENSSFLLNNNLYPNKFVDQQGRYLRMACFRYEPYSIYEPETDGYFGSELSFAREYAKYHNMTPVPIVNENDYWGTIFANWTGNGVLGNIVEDNADIGFSALYTWEVYYHFLDLSKPLVRTGITCLVPAPKPAASWLTPLFAFSSTLWIAIGVTVLYCGFNLCSITIMYINIHHPRYKFTLTSLVQILFNSFGTITKLLLLQPITYYEVPPYRAVKYLLLIVLILSLLLNNIYYSGFSSVLTVPRFYSAIDTVDEFANSGIKWGATSDAWITSIQKAEEKSYVDIVSKFIIESEDNLREFSKSDHFALSVERLPYQDFAIGTYIKQDVIEKYHLMREDLYWEQCLIYARKSSILLPTLDMFILKIFEAGLISHWQNKAVSSYMDPIVQKAVRFYSHHNIDERHITELKFVHVEGAFAILGFGYILSAVVFLVELAHYHLMKIHMTDTVEE